jgi:hypothetical protein
MRRVVPALWVVAGLAISSDEATADAEFTERAPRDAAGRAATGETRAPCAIRRKDDGNPRRAAADALCESGMGDCRLAEVFEIEADGLRGIAEGARRGADASRLHADASRVRADRP